VLQALAVPEDVIASWGWWRRARRMTGYYGALSAQVLLAIADLIPLVRIRPISPGLFDVVAVPPHPDWSAMGAAVPVASLPPAKVLMAPAEETDDDAVRPARRPDSMVAGGARLRAPPASARVGGPANVQDRK
jgi:hypothetical protein